MDAGFRALKEVTAGQGGVFHGDYELGFGLGIRQGLSLAGTLPTV